MNFRENLIQFRKAKYPSARKFAQELGIPYNTYLSYENDRTEIRNAGKNSSFA